MTTAHPWADGPHPWREWRNWPEHRLWWRHLPEGIHAVTDGRENTWHNIRELQVERRYSTRHEQEHIIAGHDGCVSGTEESRICFRAAQWLVPDPRQVAKSLVWAEGDIALAADDLWLPERGMRARLDHRFMHPAEYRLIQKLVLEAIDR